MLLLGFIFVFSFVKAQGNKPVGNEVERAYQSFEKDFNKEMGVKYAQKPESQKPNQIIAWHTPVQLPEWLFNYASSNQHSTIAIGISDPGLDTLVALKQARIRALAMIALMNESKVQNISDNYYIDQAGKKTLGKFNSFSNITGEAWFAENSVELLEMVYTSNQEMIIVVRVKIDPKNKKDCHHVKCNIEFFQSEHGLSSRNTLLNRMLVKIEETNCKNEANTFEWLQNEGVKGADISSLWNGQPLPVVTGKFKYLMPGTAKGNESENDFPAEFDLTFGLWNAYISAFILQLENMDVFNSQVKYLDDTFDKQFQDLTRVISSNSLKPEPVSFYIRENKLVLETAK